MTTMPGYRHESDTSRAAAERLTSAQKNQRAALRFIRERGLHGATIDEVCVFLSTILERQVPPNAISGRFIELEAKELISKTPQRRKTRTGRNAVVYVAGTWRDHVEAAPAPVSRPDAVQAHRPSQVHVYKAKLAATGHGHVVPRNDGRKDGCGGLVSCKICRMERDYFENLKQKEKSLV
jgi:hypothetical protein